MSKHGDYLPPQEAALIDWGDNFVAELTEYGTEWEIPAAEGAGVTTALAAFKAAGFGVWGRGLVARGRSAGGLLRGGVASAGVWRRGCGGQEDNL